jgi:hypothetical protein
MAADHANISLICEGQMGGNAIRWAAHTPLASSQHTSTSLSLNRRMDDRVGLGEAC